MQGKKVDLSVERSHWKMDSISEREHWLDNIYSIYDRMKAKAINGPYETHCHVPLCVYPCVYSPDFFTDSFWFSQHLPNIIGKGSSVLEIGTGTGIIGIMLARSGASVLATDINHAAVDNARLNVARHNLENVMSVRWGHLFEVLRIDERFDYIFWAHPFNNWPVPVGDMLLRSGMDHNYNDFREYVTCARNYLMPGGKLLLGTGDSADLGSIWDIAVKNRYQMIPIKQEKVPLEEGQPLTIEYRIYEFNDINL
jgi:release factor glutamine methyltransferase